MVGEFHFCIFCRSVGRSLRLYVQWYERGMTPCGTDTMGKSKFKGNAVETEGRNEPKKGRNTLHEVLVCCALLYKIAAARFLE